MTNLKEVNFGLNQYCGPAVLSALTGESTDRCAAVISAVSGRQEIKAVSTGHLIEALKRLKFNTEETIFGGSTLYGTLHRMHTHDGLYVVFVPHHVVAVEVKDCVIYICDNHTKTPMDIKQSARLTQRVSSVLKVTPHPLPVFVRSEVILEQDESFGRNRINLSRILHYVNKEDDVKESLGYIRYRDVEELAQIFLLLRRTSNGTS